ncbi:MAG: ribosome small subunit-dependent GTPase A [Burkholderiales bacterium]|nr:MAG: ribosome small subunit-dependent GTPase A [Burkholderiales bacterium]
MNRASVAGIVVAAYGRHSVVVTAEHDRLVCVTRGRRTDLVVGDRVQSRATGGGTGVIERIEPRRNAFSRADSRRVKRIAANVDQIGYVIAPQPPFSESLLVRALAAAAKADARALIIVNKRDLLDAMAEIEPRLAVYERLGYRVLRIAPKPEPSQARDALLPLLAGQTTALAGQSGMGKSTLVNALIPQAELQTREISKALGTGRHTTTFTRAFELPQGGTVIDTPGFQTFGIEHLSASEFQHTLPDFEPLLGRCRFHNCKHAEEPGCAVRAAARSGLLDARRYALYREIAAELHWG